MVGPAYGARITSHTLRAAVLPLGDQLGSFEHGHVLLHGGKRHLIARGQLADGRVGVHHTRQDVAPRGVGQRAEQLIEVVRRWLIYNHLVVYISTPFAPARGEHTAQKLVNIGVVFSLVRSRPPEDRDIRDLRARVSEQGALLDARLARRHSARIGTGYVQSSLPARGRPSARRARRARCTRSPSWSWLSSPGS